MYSKMSGWYECAYDSSLHFYVPPAEFVNITGNSLKLAGFDLDGTLIHSDRGEKFVTKATNWVFTYSNTREIMHSYLKEGNTLAIFSNRKGDTGKTLESTKARVEELFRRIGMHCFVFLATEENEFRKPNVGMLDFMLKLCSCESFEEGSFYTGDAEGEDSEDPWHRWADSDISLIRNWNNFRKDTLFFKTPQSIFEEFSFQEQSNIKLFITCGQIGSGYDSLSLKGITVGSVKTLPSNSTMPIAIIDSHPTIGERDQVRARYGVTREESMVLWFSRSCKTKIAPFELKAFSSAFQHPDLGKEKYIRLN